MAIIGQQDEGRMGLWDRGTMGRWDDSADEKISKSQSLIVKTIGLNGKTIQPYMIERLQMRPNHMRAAI